MTDAQPTPSAPAESAVPAAVAPMAHAPNAAGPVQVDAASNAEEGQEAAFQLPVPLPREYQLPSWQAQQSGLQVDFVAEKEMREAFHAAGVDQNLASSLYTVALRAARQELSPLAIATEYAAGERSLRQAWGRDFDANLKVANEAGRELFNALPESIRRGMSYGEFALAAGFANSAPIAKMLLIRARTRSGRSKNSP